MRTRSEWFLAGDVHGGSLEINPDMHLRPPPGAAAATLTVAGIGAYRSHDDLTHYRNDDFLLNSNFNDSDFVVASSLMSASYIHHNHHPIVNNHNHNMHHHNDHQPHNLFNNFNAHDRHNPNGGAKMMFFTVLDMLF